MFIRTFISAVAFSLVLTALSDLQAEVTDVTLTWRAIQCNAECNKRLAVQFGKIYGVASVNVDQGSGQANLTWKPNVPFSFIPINTALRLVGPSISTIRVKVRGKIQHNPSSVKLISDQDGTEFYLLNPIIPVNNQFVITGSVYNRQLTPDLRAQLLDAQAKKQMVVIEGPLFEPYRSPPLQLVIEHLSFEDAK